MSYPVTIYVDANGTTYGAAKTDQRYTQTGSDRTVYGSVPVVCAGRWYPSQMPWGPYRAAVKSAQERARKRGGTPA